MLNSIYHGINLKVRKKNDGKSLTFVELFPHKINTDDSSLCYYELRIRGISSDLNCQITDDVVLGRINKVHCVMSTTRQFTCMASYIELVLLLCPKASKF